MPSTFKNLLKLAKNTIKQGIKVTNSRPNSIRHFKRTFITKHPIKLIKPFNIFNQKHTLKPFQFRALSYLNKKNNFTLKNLTNNSSCLTIFFKKNLVTWTDLDKNQKKLYETFSKLSEKTKKAIKPDKLAEIVNKAGKNADSDDAIKILAKQFNLTTYSQLTKKQQCIYDSFTQLDDRKDDADAESMGLYVNSKGISADSEYAVMLLAHKYGLNAKYGGPGDQFGEIGFEKNEQGIFVINDLNVAPYFKKQFGASLNPNVENILVFEPIDDEKNKIDFIWHAVYAKYGKKKGKESIIFSDPQNSRAKGPRSDDYFVYFTNK